MRWREKPEHKRGDTRVKRRFLFFPECLRHEWRWLEWATIEETYVIGVCHAGWLPVRFVDIGEENNDEVRGI